MIELALGEARVVFSTRQGGVSTGPYESLNLGILTDDDPAAVADNRGLFAAAAGLDAVRIVMSRQVHGTDLQEWSEQRGDKPIAEADGHVTAVPGLGLAVLAADCLPVALAGSGRIAMAHCGWRGLAAGILAQAVARFDSAPSAAVGPGIGVCCYEVGPEVGRAFQDVPGAVRGRMLDLRVVAEARLREAGVDDITHVNLCTSCREDLFFSHRRDQGVTGRQAGMVWLEQS